MRLEFLIQWSGRSLAEYSEKQLASHCHKFQCRNLLDFKGIRNAVLRWECCIEWVLGRVLGVRFGWLTFSRVNEDLFCSATDRAPPSRRHSTSARSTLGTATIPDGGLLFSSVRHGSFLKLVLHWRRCTRDGHSMVVGFAFAFCGLPSVTDLDMCSLSAAFVNAVKFHEFTGSLVFFTRWFTEPIPDSTNPTMLLALPTFKNIEACHWRRPHSLNASQH